MINTEFKNSGIRLGVDLLIMACVWLSIVYGCISSLIFDSDQRRFFRDDYLAWKKRKRK